MSVHYRHIQRIQLAANHDHNPHDNKPLPANPQLKTPAFRSRIHRHALANAHTNAPVLSASQPAGHPLTPFEMIILLFALGILIALVFWLLWIMLEYCVTFTKEKLDDMSIGRRLRGHDYGREQVSKRKFSMSERMAKMGLGNVAEIAGAIFGNGEDGSSRRLLGEREAGGESGERGGRGYGAGYGYGHREEMLYSSSVGGDGRPKDSDPTSESSGCVGPLYGHREECVGDCTLQTRRRSRES